MKVIFFGASVTQQYTNHKTGELTGYVPWLQKLIKKQGLEITIKCVAAGSSHFNDAGYLLLPKVLKENPDILIIEWHTTGSNKFDPLLWNAFLSKIIDQSIQLVIAILPQKNLFESGERKENYIQAEKVACESIHLLDGYKFKGFSPEKHLRDGVHTTSEGGKFYASNFLNYLKPFAKKQKIFDGYLDTSQYSFYLTKSERPTIDVWTFNLGNYIKTKRIRIKYEIDCTLLPARLMMDLTIGPDSPVLDLIYGGKIKKNESLWDPYCHFKRKFYKCIILEKNQEILEIEISNQLPNYSKCRNKEFDFSEFANKDKYIFLSNIFIIGGKLNEIEHSL